MNVTLPKSISAMHESTELMQGVFNLAEKLNGKKMVAQDWKEARQYSKALTMAAVARGDYVVLMHDLWDHIFGAAVMEQLGSIDQDPSEYSPSEIWGHYEIGKSLTLHTPINQIEVFYLYLNYDLETQKFKLSLGSFDTDRNQLPIPEALGDLNGWYLKHEGDWDEQFLYSPQIDAIDFSTGIDKTVAEANQMLSAMRTLPSDLPARVR